MRQTSVVEDLQAVRDIMQHDPDKARAILGRIIYELQHETVITPEYVDLLGEYEALQEAITRRRRKLEQEEVKP